MGMEFWGNKTVSENKEGETSKSEKEIAIDKWQTIKEDHIKNGDKAGIKRANEALRKLENFDSNS